MNSGGRVNETSGTKGEKLSKEGKIEDEEVKETEGKIC